jgi:hypothetical protein
MTKEELEKRLPKIVEFGKKHNYNVTDIAKEALYEGYEAGYEAGKPKWHEPIKVKEE